MTPIAAWEILGGSRGSVLVEEENLNVFFAYHEKFMTNSRFGTIW